jgi:large subunit ribosomal protein L6
MKKLILEQLDIPAGVTCEFSDSTLKCKKDGTELSRKITVPRMTVAVKDNKINLGCESGNKRDFKTIKSYIAHIKNMFTGLQQEYVYKLEYCNVHFPMTLKIESNRVVINNFLGEKNPRFAKIVSGVKVDLKGQKLTVTSADKDAAGQTAANLEKATKIKNRDRRIFQDGIFITDRPGGAK